MRTAFVFLRSSCSDARVRPIHPKLQYHIARSRLLANMMYSSERGIMNISRACPISLIPSVTLTTVSLWLLYRCAGDNTRWERWAHTDTNIQCNDHDNTVAKSCRIKVQKSRGINCDRARSTNYPSPPNSWLMSRRAKNYSVISAQWLTRTWLKGWSFCRHYQELPMTAKIAMRYKFIRWDWKRLFVRTAEEATTVSKSRIDNIT